MKRKIRTLLSICLLAVFSCVCKTTSAQQVTIQDLALTASNNIGFDINGPAGVAHYKVYGTNDVTAALATWPLLAEGILWQTNFSLPMSWPGSGYYYVTTNDYETNDLIPVAIQLVTQGAASGRTKSTNFFTGPVLTDQIVPGNPGYDFANNTIPPERSLNNNAYEFWLEAQIPGDTTNNYTFYWQVLDDSFEPFSDAGITGYHTPTIAVLLASMLQEDYNIRLTITRLADGYQTVYLLLNVPVTSSILESEYDTLFYTCQNSTNACPTCDCNNANLLPATDP